MHLRTRRPQPSQLNFSPLLSPYPSYYLPPFSQPSQLNLLPLLPPPPPLLPPFSQPSQLNLSQVDQLIDHLQMSRSAMRFIRARELKQITYTRMYTCKTADANYMYMYLVYTIAVSTFSKCTCTCKLIRFVHARTFHYCPSY